MSVKIRYIAVITETELKRLKKPEPDADKVRRLKRLLKQFKKTEYIG